MSIEIVDPGGVASRSSAANRARLAAKNIAAGYIRVSTDRQSLSPDAQEKQIREYCAEHGYRLEDRHIVREVKSARSIVNRPQLRKVLGWADEYRIGRVIVQDLTRAFRNIKDALVILDQLVELGVSLESVIEPEDRSTADGEFMFHLRLVLGQRERRLIGERTARAIRLTKNVSAGQAKWNACYAAKHRDGKLVVGNPPYGYKWHWHKKIFVTNEKEMYVVRQVIARWHQGVGVSKIIEWLEAHDLAPRAAGCWHGKQIYRILDRHQARGPR